MSDSLARAFVRHACAALTDCLLQEKSNKCVASPFFLLLLLCPAHTNHFLSSCARQPTHTQQTPPPALFNTLLWADAGMASGARRHVSSTFTPVLPSVDAFSCAQ